MPLLTGRADIDVVNWTEDRRCDRAWLLQNIPGASGLVVCFQDIVDREVVDVGGPNLRVVSTISVGYEHIDLDVMAERKIQVGYTPDILTDAVADSAVMLALMATRAAGQSYTFVKNNQWPSFNWTPFAFCGPQLSTTSFSPTRTVGFLGFGRIAHAVLARLAAFGITHCIYTPRPGAPPQTARDAHLQSKHNLTEVAPVDLPTLARRSDVLFVLAPGGPATHHLIDSAFLRQMKPSSVLVNNGRGSVVDSIALAQALKEGWIWGAGLDVVDEEAIPGGVTAEHPLVCEPRCVVLPHIGSAAQETREEMARLTARNVIAGVLGEELPVALDYSRLGSQV
ncbi:D-isomer specific 2-hydroxyacid dehydrogenase [Roridomyces roridus]|uniref:D-isomer specific 2-hydroxyacid dehydrogenase n=1 Tax=Roridomyces roridus TaxID=1738132 RepID=A0AAD7CGK7_9AGAR|nr:D-isomer specific 2-hydroxyacid dehydrogenase [Roridomyces roridus]